MRIKLLISVAGADFSNVPGDLVDWPDDAAAGYIAAGYAEAVVAAPADDSTIKKGR